MSLKSAADGAAEKTKGPTDPRVSSAQAKDENPGMEIVETPFPREMLGTINLFQAMSEDARLCPSDIPAVHITGEDGKEIKPRLVATMAGMMCPVCFTQLTWFPMDFYKQCVKFEVRAHVRNEVAMEEEREFAEPRKTNLRKDIYNLALAMQIRLFEREEEAQKAGTAWNTQTIYPWRQNSTVSLVEQFAAESLDFVNHANLKLKQASDVDGVLERAADCALMGMIVFDNLHNALREAGRTFVPIPTSTLERLAGEGTMLSPMMKEEREKQDAKSINGTAMRKRPELTMKHVDALIKETDRVISNAAVGRLSDGTLVTQDPVAKVISRAGEGRGKHWQTTKTPITGITSVTILDREYKPIKQYNFTQRDLDDNPGWREVVNEGSLFLKNWNILDAKGGDYYDYMCEINNKHKDIAEKDRKLTETDARHKAKGKTLAEVFEEEARKEMKGL